MSKHSSKTHTTFRDLVAKMRKQLQMPVENSEPSVWTMGGTSTGDINNGIAVALALSPHNTRTIEQDSLDNHIFENDSIELRLKNPAEPHYYENRLFRRDQLPNVFISSTLEPVQLHEKSISHDNRTRMTFDHTLSVKLGLPDLDYDSSYFSPEEDINIIYRHQLNTKPELKNVPNALVVDTVPSRVNAQSLAEGKISWGKQLDHFKAHHPVYFVVLGERVDGNDTLAMQDACNLADKVTQVAKKNGGAVVFTTSPRTRNPQQIISAFSHRLEKENIPAYFFDYSKQHEGPNPYIGLLALADRIIVTDDSMSMSSDAIATGKPVFQFNRTPSVHTENEKPPEKTGHAAYNAVLKEKKLILPMSELDNPNVQSQHANSANEIADAIRAKLALWKHMETHVLRAKRYPRTSLNRLVPLTRIPDSTQQR